MKIFLTIITLCLLLILSVSSIPAPIPPPTSNCTVPHPPGHQIPIVPIPCDDGTN